MKKLLTITVLFILVLSSCKKAKHHEDSPSSSNPLFTTWEFVWFEDYQQYMVKADQLPEEKYGFTFTPDGRFIEMKNSSVCSTNGCFEYAVYEGTWHYLGNNTYRIEAPYWGGEMEYNIQVISIKNDTLIYTIPFPPE